MLYITYKLMNKSGADNSYHSYVILHELSWQISKSRIIVLCIGSVSRTAWTRSGLIISSQLFIKLIADNDQKCSKWKPYLDITEYNNATRLVGINWLNYTKLQLQLQLQCFVLHPGNVVLESREYFASALGQEFPSVFMNFLHVKKTSSAHLCIVMILLYKTSCRIASLYKLRCKWESPPPLWLLFVVQGQLPFAPELVKTSQG